MKPKKEKSGIEIWFVVFFMLGVSAGLLIAMAIQQPQINSLREMKNDWRTVAIKGVINNHLCTEVFTGERKPIIKDIGDIFCKIRHGQDAVYHFENETHVCYYGLERSEIT